MIERTLDTAGDPRISARSKLFDRGLAEVMKESVVGCGDGTTKIYVAVIFGTLIVRISQETNRMPSEI